LDWSAALGQCVCPAAWNVETAALAGNGQYRDQHDTIAHVVFGSCISMGLRGQTKVRGIFSSAIPADLLYSHTDPEGQNDEERQRSPCAGAIPDARINIDGSNKLMDIKCIHFGRSNYWRDGEGGTCGSTLLQLTRVTRRNEPAPRPRSPTYLRN